MSTGPLDLLRLLGSGVRTPVEGAGGRGDVAGATFGDLLARARSGEVASGRACAVASGAGVTLTDDQLARVAPAADRAEMLGAASAAVLVDGRALTLDVASRRITGEIGAGRTPSHAAVGAVVAAAPGDAAPNLSIATPFSTMTTSYSAAGAAMLRRLRGLTG